MRPLNHNATSTMTDRIPTAILDALQQLQAYPAWMVVSGFFLALVLMAVVPLLIVGGVKGLMTKPRTSRKQDEKFRALEQRLERQRSRLAPPSKTLAVPPPRPKPTPPPQSTDTGTIAVPVATSQSSNGDDSSAEIRLVQQPSSPTELATNGDPSLAKIESLGGRVVHDGQQNVVMVYLNDKQITRETIGLLAQLPKLESLHLRRTDVDDQFVEKFAQLPQLKYLYVTETKLTKDGINKLQLLRPHLKIEA